jgi:deoxyribodipyrimidine photo-lyase
MPKKFQSTLFIFRRDLRLEDNTGLLFALKESEKVIPCFIFTPQQISHNPYLSKHCLQFMIESLEDLESSLKKQGARLFLFFDSPEKVIQSCITHLGIDAVVINRDYTPYSLARDQQIEALCKQSKIAFNVLDDALLHPPEHTTKSDGTPYSIFTPFFKNASRLEVPAPVMHRHHNYDTRPIPFAKSSSLYQEILPQRLSQAPGGRKAALHILKHLNTFSHYENLRDFPAKKGTTHLSPHLKFTTCSPREVYYAICSQLGKSSPLIRSLYWRDFFTSIAFYFPCVFQRSFHQKFDHLKWDQDKTLFKKWCEGQTGFPIVDAGMREMNRTGHMHNRVRMIAASFLVKDLHIDWRWGEKYFAQTLIDYDPAVNNGNWQWVASTGCDSQPYFRIFNPWMQQLKFDPDCFYIKNWIPELSSLSSSVIHTWHLDKHSDYNTDYPRPIVDHAQESKMTLDHYKKIATQRKSIKKN